jgi:RNA recognition motif-containing protein
MNHDEEHIISNKGTNNNSNYQTADVPHDEESIGETGRLFVRNLPYICTEYDLLKKKIKKMLITFSLLTFLNAKIPYYNLPN